MIDQDKKRVAMKILRYTNMVMANCEKGTSKHQLAYRIFVRHYGTAMSSSKK